MDQKPIKKSLRKCVFQVNRIVLEDRANHRIMNRLLKPVIGAVIVFSFSVAAVVYWLYPEETGKAPNIVSISRFDSIFSKDISLATSLADMPDLREFSLGGDDIEVRIWRAHSLPAQEGVFLKRSNGKWSGLHIRFKTDQNGDVQAAEVEQLKTPELGWEAFWGKLVDKGILTFPLTPENECDTRGFDGIHYVVEINQNNTYRNYQYAAGDDDCRESKQMTEIGQIIGLEFDSGPQQCKTTYEWFACAKTKR
jgi:hypothetical protein